MSVDLIGSTAFKEAEHGQRVADDGLSSIWSSETRSFYREFPKLLSGSYAREAAIHKLGVDTEPKLWKTIGDEIVFCCRVLNLEHLSACVTGFLRAVYDFGLALEGTGGHLDVKGCGWIATFPMPNVAIPIAGRRADQRSPDLPFDEEDEKLCDRNPEEFDFLGRHIDMGFRLSKFAEADRFVVSVELAYLLADKSLPKLFHGTFDYHGRERMKGVLENRPYPMVAIDTERSETNRDLRTAERALVGRPGIEAHQVRTFLQHFAKHERVELPILPKGSSPITDGDLPDSYVKFLKRWEAAKSRIDETVEREVRGADSANSGGRMPEGERPKTFLEGIAAVMAARTRSKIRGNDPD